MISPHSRAIRVLIVDDHEAVAQALTTLLEASPDVKVVGRARSVRSAIESSRRVTPDVVLMDYQLPDGTGATASLVIRQQPSPPAVLFLSADQSEMTRRRVFESGASGFLSKSCGIREIPDAVRRVARGMPLPGSIAIG